MSKGAKQCPSCQKSVGPRSYVCKYCNHEFSIKGKKNKRSHHQLKVVWTDLCRGDIIKVIAGSGKGDTIPFHCMTDMVDGDYIEVYVANISGARDVTLENMNVIISELT